MKSTMKKINDVIAEISHLTKDDLAKQLSSFEFAEKPKKKKGFDVPNAVQGHVVTRFPQNRPATLILAMQKQHALIMKLQSNMAARWYCALMILIRKRNPRNMWKH